jgi:hypothetical protein
VAVIKYCVFWIPTKYHVETWVPLKYNVSGNISDNENSQHNVTINLLSGFNITIKNDSGLITTLEHEKHSSNGLFQYKYNSDENSFISQEVPNAIYHLIKELFHIHEYHECSADSLLNAYVSDKRCEIRDINNDAIVHYFKNFEEIFLGFTNSISALYGKTVLNKNEKARKFQMLESHKEIQDLCHNALGQFLYFNTLINSKYVIINQEDQKNSDDLRMRLLKIKNLIEGIRLIQNKIQVELDIKRTMISFKNSTRGFLLSGISIVVGAIGIYLTVKSFQTPKYANRMLKIEQQIEDKLK